MQSIVKVLADTLLVDLFNKNSKCADISKNEFDVMMEAYKKDHENQNTKKPQQKYFYCGFFVVPPDCKLDTSCNYFPYQIRFSHPICYFLQLNGVKNQLYI